MLTTRTRAARSAFTLVELLVATALVIIILAILAVAFGSASDSFSRLKAVGDMASKLRTAQDKVRTDLESPHIDAGDAPAGQKLSDLRYDLLGTTAGANVRTPNAGYLRIEHGLGSTYEGLDADGVISTRAAGAHALEFTVKRTGKTPDQLFTVQSATMFPYSVTDTAVGASQFSANWARVRWQLGNPRTQTFDTGVVVTTYTLFRSVRVLAPEPAPGGPAIVSIPAANPGEAELFSTTPVSPNPGPYAPHTLRTVTPPAVRATSPIAPYTFTQTHYGDDIILENVISFQVKPTWVPGPGVRGPRQSLPVASTAPGTVIPDGIPGVPPTPAAPTTTNTQYPFDDLPATPAGSANPRVFDTGNDVTTLPLRVRITALEVTIRVFDPKSQMTRQVSFVVPQ